MNKASVKACIAVVVILAVATIGYLKYQNHVLETEYEALENNYNQADYQAFIKKHPGSELTKEVILRLEKLKYTQGEWNKIKDLDKRSLYATFLAEYPQSAYTELCKDKIDSLDWIDANSENSIDAYQKYLELHATGKYAELAQKYSQELNNLIPTESEKNDVQNLISEFVEALNGANSEKLQSICSKNIMSQIEELMGENKHFAITTNLNISKTPSRQSNNNNLVAIFQLEINNGTNMVDENGETNNNMYEGNFVITPSMHIVYFKLVAIQPQPEEETNE